MTALTWKQAKRKYRCDCMDRDAYRCACATKQGCAKCGCHCHIYTLDAETAEQIGEQRSA